MLRTALLFSAPALVALACIVPPDDAAQIRALVRDRAEAIERGDRAAFYRLHDIDYRAVCPFARFAALPAPEHETVLGVHEITVRGVRGSALVDVATSGGRRSARREFVKDAGRWYLYEDAAPCESGVWSPVSGVRATRERRTPHAARRTPDTGPTPWMI